MVPSGSAFSRESYTACMYGDSLAQRESFAAKVEAASCTPSVSVPPLPPEASPPLVPPLPPDEHPARATAAAVATARTAPRFNLNIFVLPVAEQPSWTVLIWNCKRNSERPQGFLQPVAAPVLRGCSPARVDETNQRRLLLRYAIPKAGARVAIGCHCRPCA